MNKQNINELYLLIEWLNGNPAIDGAYYFDNKEDAIKYYNDLPKIIIPGFVIEYTICRIYNKKT